jgi:hypothetical protein
VTEGRADAARVDSFRRLLASREGREIRPEQETTS